MKFSSRSLFLLLGLVLGDCSMSYSQTFTPSSILKLDELHQKAPALVYLDGQGQSHSIADLHGKRVVIHIWATWCTQCRKEIPELASKLDIPDLGVVFVPLALEESQDLAAVKRFLTGLHPPITPNLIVSARSSKDYWSWGIPMTYFINENGAIVARAMGPRDWKKISNSQLKEFLDQLFKTTAEKSD